MQLVPVVPCLFHVVPCEERVSVLFVPSREVLEYCDGVPPEPRQVPNLLQLIPFSLLVFISAPSCFQIFPPQLWDPCQAHLSLNLGLGLIPCFCKYSLISLAILPTTPMSETEIFMVYGLKIFFMKDLVH